MEQAEVTGKKPKMDAVNDLSGRLSTVIDGLVPVSGGLEDFTGALPAVAEAFAEASRAFGGAAGAALPGTDAVSDALSCVSA